MTKLTDTQAVILTTAAQRDRLLALPFPDSLRVRGGAATKVVTAMVAKGLLAETPARAGEPVWSETDDSGPITLVATVDGLAAIGIEPDGAEKGFPGEKLSEPAPAAADAPSAAPQPRTGGRKGKAAPKPRTRGKAAQAAPRATDGAKAATTRPASKQSQLIDMLRRPQGASISEISETFGWLPHTTRGAIAGALKRKLGLDVQSEKVDGRGTVYRLPA